MTFSQRLTADWYRPRLTPLTAALWPLSLVFRAIVATRRFLYRIGVLKSSRVRAPVIVVGSILAGGTGKTPLVRALAAGLAQEGWHPGLVARGYGGTDAGPRAVRQGDDPAIVGDESLLLAADGFPLWIGHERAAAARALLAAHDCDIVIADDGLQHYALDRDFEIAVLDQARGLGNGAMLPAGPLREARRRLAEVDAIVRLLPPDAASEKGDEIAMRYDPLPWVNLARPGIVPDLEAWRRGTVHALAGIGDPERFFASLRRLRLDPVCHAFPDHHRYSAEEVRFPDATAILLTEKDAVKCAAFADARFWYLPIRARIDPSLIARVTKTLRGRQAA